MRLEAFVTALVLALACSGCASSPVREWEAQVLREPAVIVGPEIPGKQ